MKNILSLFLFTLFAFTSYNVFATDEVTAPYFEDFGTIEWVSLPHQDENDALFVYYILDDETLLLDSNPIFNPWKKGDKLQIDSFNKIAYELDENEPLIIYNSSQNDLRILHVVNSSVTNLITFRL